MRENFVTQVLIFLAYMAAQVFLFNNLILFNTAFCFMYVGFLLILPIESNKLLVIFLGFLSGWLIDIFFQSYGINSAASLAIAFMRSPLTSLITPRGGYEENSLPTLRAQGLIWFVSYTLPLVFIHHAILFLLESWGFSNFGFTLSKILASTFFTFFVLLMIQYLFYSKRR